MSVLRGYDIDGVLTIGIRPEAPYVVISGRTLAEYNEFAKQLAQNTPVYIRGTGAMGDREAAGRFKALMINTLGVNEFYEDDIVQLQIIKSNCSTCKIYHVINLNEIMLVN